MCLPLLLIKAYYGYDFTLSSERFYAFVLQLFLCRLVVSAPFLRKPTSRGFLFNLSTLILYQNFSKKSKFRTIFFLKSFSVTQTHHEEVRLCVHLFYLGRDERNRTSIFAFGEHHSAIKPHPYIYINIFRCSCWWNRWESDPRPTSSLRFYLVVDTISAP